jgi:hypothetical protein
MGMTLWIHTLEGHQMSKESDDHTLMYDLADELDVVCKDSNVTLFSSFFDTTDLESSFAEDFDEDEDEIELDPETGYTYGIDDMKWFLAADGLSTMRVLREKIAAGWKPELESEYREFVLEEFDDCITRLQALPSEGKFHLAVIM